MRILEFLVYITMAVMIGLVIAALAWFLVAALGVGLALGALP